jgi:antitoxin (DNA-binding transcriptional repressor) of toxin-antitoxin stability system
VTLEEAQARLPEIIDDLVSDEELLITLNNQLVAKLVGQQQPVRKHASLGYQRQAGDSR